MPGTDAKRKTRHVGRRARARYSGGTVPGKILLLAVLSAVPILYLFVVMPLAGTPLPPPEMVARRPGWTWLFLLGTPLASAAALTIFYRAPAWARDHNAARAGRFLAFANLGLWALYGGIFALWIAAGRPSA